MLLRGLALLVEAFQTVDEGVVNGWEVVRAVGILPFSRDEGDDRFVLARWKLLNQGAGNCGCGRKVRAKSAVGIFELFELAAVGQQHDEPASNEYFTLHAHTTSSFRSPVDPAVAPAAPGPQSASRPVGWLLPVNEPRSSGGKSASAPLLGSNASLTRRSIERVMSEHAWIQ